MKNILHSRHRFQTSVILITASLLVVVVPASALQPQPIGKGGKGLVAHLTSSSVVLSALPGAPQFVGTSITLTATVSGSGSPGPTGTVNFEDNGVSISGCSAQTLSSEVATCVTTSLLAGTNPLKGIYSGDANFSTSTSTTLSYTMSSAPNAPTGVSAMATKDSATVSWTAATPNGGLPVLGYTVTASTGQTCTLSTSPTPASLKCTVPDLSGGSPTFTVTATSAGGTGPPSAPSNSVTPSLAPVTVSLSAYPVSAYPTASQNLNNPVTFTAVISPETATGWVEFENAGTAIMGCTTQSVTDGIATCTTTTLPAGTSTISAAYLGDVNDAPSTSASLSYVVSSTTLTTNPPLVVTSVSGPFTSNLALTFSGGLSTATTTFTVVDGTAAGCAVTVTGGTADLSVSDPGTCLVTATQAASGTYLGESSNVTTVVMYSFYVATYVSSSGSYTCPQGGTVVDVSYCSLTGSSPSVPGTPTAVVADSGSGSALVSWAAPNSSGSATVTTYTVTAIDATNSSRGGETCVVTEATGCTVTSLTNGDIYSFTVVATNVVGNSSSSAPSNSVVPLAAPGAPTGLAASVTSPTSATLTWTAPTSTGGAPIVYYTATSYLGGITAGPRCSTTSATACTITGLTTSDAYTFEVVARTVFGSSGSSAAYPANQDEWNFMMLPSVGSSGFSAWAYGGGTYLMFPYESGTDYYSTNGTTWTSATFPINSSSVVYGNGVFVALDNGTPYVAYSSNGITWTETMITPSADFAYLSFVNGVFIAAGTSSFATAAYSTNGVAWTTTSTPADAGGQVIYGDGTDMMISYSNQGVMSSVDNGVTWTYSNPTSSGSTTAIGYGNGMFVALSDGSAAAYSTNGGTTWTSTTMPSTSYDWVDVTYANGVFVAYGTNGGTGLTAYSTNGASWTTTALPEDMFQGSVVAGLDVAIDGNSGQTSAQISTNGAAWTNAYLPSTIGGSWGVPIVNGNQIYLLGFGVWGDSSVVMSDGLLMATPPSDPNGVIADVTSATTVDVSWNAPAPNGSPITSYTVTSSPGGLTCTSIVTSCTVVSLTPGTSYTFSVTATNSVGTSSASSPSASVSPANAPGAPTGVSATVGATSAAVSWSAPSSNGGSPITGYTAIASHGGLFCSTGTTSCTVSGLTTGDAYTFTVTATNAVGTSNASPQFPVAGNTWATLAPGLPASYESTAVAYGSGTVIALGDYSQLTGGYPSTADAYSTDDGALWSADGALPADVDWDAVAYGAGTFVALAHNSATVAISTNNGRSWASTALPSSEEWDSVTYGNGTFVATGALGSVAYSPNGSTWTLATSAPSAEWTSVTYGDGEFVAVAYNGTSAAYSANGVTWTRSTLPATASWSSVAYANGEFVAVSWGSTDAAYSSNGVTWSEATLPASENWSAVTFAESQFYAVASGSGATATSTSGTSWSIGSALPTANDWIALASVGNELLVSAYSSATVAVGPVNSNMSTPGLSLPGSDGAAIAYGDSTYVALGDYSALLGGSTSTTTALSTNGTSWSAGGTLPSEEWDSVAFGGGTFVGLSAEGLAAYSTNNGASWTSVGVEAVGQWSSVTYADGKFVAVDYGSGVAVYSTNGVSWTTVSMPETTNWTSVTYGDGVFVAVASASGVAAYSTNGITWTGATMPGGSWRQVIDAGGTFEALLAGGSAVAISTNGGATWTTTGPVGSTDLADAVYVDGRVVAVGASGADYVDWNVGQVT